MKNKPLDRELQLRYQSFYWNVKLDSVDRKIDALRQKIVKYLAKTTS